MNKVGILKEIDNLGRIVIPAKTMIRKTVLGRDLLFRTVFYNANCGFCKPKVYIFA